MITRYLKKIGWKRIAIMFLGNILIAMGVSIFKLSKLGNDAYNAMIMALSDCLDVDYAFFFVAFSTLLFLIEIIAGRELIGIGTIVNACTLGYLVSAWTYVWKKFTLIPQTFVQQIAVMVLGVILCSLGLSMYQKTDVGISPYDSMALILNKYIKKIPYFWCRMITDGICTIVAFVTGGIVGLGTLVCTIGLGPFIQLFDKNVTEKILFRNT